MERKTPSKAICSHDGYRKFGLHL